MKRSEFYFSHVKDVLKEYEEDFIANFEEDNLPGYPESQAGSMFTSEAQFVYSIIKTLKPNKILEIGNWKGSTSNHIIKAASSYGGTVTLVDINDHIDYKNLIKYEKTNRVIQDSKDHLRDESNIYDLIVQDGDHSYAYVKEELEILMKTHKKFICIAHDWKACPEIFRALEDLKDKFKTLVHIHSPESDCGISLVIYES